MRIETFSIFVIFSSAIAGNHYRLLENYDPHQPKPCSNATNPNVTGGCMFVWDCHRMDGRSLGICNLDIAIFGTCCHHNGTVNEVIPPTTTSSPEFDYENGSPNVDVEVENIPPPSPTPPNPYSECGISSYERPNPERSRRTPEFRIVGGEPAVHGQWPWVVSIRRASLFGYTSTHSCGGVVVNENWIVTAGSVSTTQPDFKISLHPIQFAHCVAALSKSLIRVRLGDLDFKTEHDTAQIPFIEKKIDRKVIYPTYNFSSFENDLALLKLSESITFNPNIRPLCLAGQGSSRESYIGHNGTIVGWGRISENGQYSQEQLFVKVPIISNPECIQMFKNSGRDELISDLFICAGYAMGGRDGCQGDSGGPLTLKDPNGKWNLVGIMSWGIGCGEPHQPGVYTFMPLFTDWIQKNIA